MDRYTVTAHIDLEANTPEDAKKVVRIALTGYRSVRNVEIPEVKRLAYDAPTLGKETVPNSTLPPLRAICGV